VEGRAGAALFFAPFEEWRDARAPTGAGSCARGRRSRRRVRLYLKIDGQMVYLWRAVDAEGEVLNVLVQSKRNKHAALKLMRELLKKYALAPKRLVGPPSVRTCATARLVNQPRPPPETLLCRDRATPRSGFAWLATAAKDTNAIFDGSTLRGS
jgi:transposase-like protein